MRTVLLLLLALTLSAQATTPEETVKSFYKTYMASMDKPGWVKNLLEAQKANVDPELSKPLLKLSQGDPNRGEDFLDFDPFSNSQMGIETYTVQKATMKDGLAYVPVAIKLYRAPGPEKVLLRVVLRPNGQGWQIANLVYPASDGAAAWDLKGYLKQTR